MATCNDVIKTALKLGRVIASGVTPTTDEYADGLIALQSMFDGWRTGGMFGELEDVYLIAGESDVAEEGKRYFTETGATLTTPTSVYLDSLGDTRQPRDLALYESLTEAGTQAAKVYDRTAWVDVIGLTGAGACPLASRGMMGLAACLAVSEAFLAEFNDAQVSPRVERLAKNFLRNIMAKHGSTQDRGTVDYY